MTADADMARLLLAVEAARAKVVIVGDDRQLSAVGPGGALAAVLHRHPEIVTTLNENLRQRDPAERDALLHLRSGDLDQAIAYYADHGRIVTNPERLDLLNGIVQQWAADVAAGHDTLMLAWTRHNVDALNQLARHHARSTGRLTGPNIEAPGGRRYAVGDLVVTLAPNYRGQLVTSETGQVTAVDPDACAVTIRTETGRSVTLLGSEIGRDRLGHGYALTVHREQGATADRTHYLADGGGRELAYVALSRGRHHNTIHIRADDLDQAAEILRDDWQREQRQIWLTPTTNVGHDTRTQPAPALTSAAQRRRLQSELTALLALEPPDPTNELAAAERDLVRLQADREHLVAGTGRYATTPVGRVARQLNNLDHDITHAQARIDHAKPWERPKLRRHLQTLHNYQAATLDEWQQHGEPEARQLDIAITRTEDHADQLRADQRFNQRWHRDHPEHAQRVATVRQLLADHTTNDEPQQTALPAVSSEPGVDPETPADAERLAARLDRLQHQPRPPSRDAGALGL